MIDISAMDIYTVLGALSSGTGLAAAALLATLIMLGQTTDPISGGAGWVGAGLLGAVLSWLLLVHLPNKDKQLRELIGLKDDMMKSMSDSCERRLDTAGMLYKSEMADTRAQFKLSLEAIILHCEKEGAKLAEAIQTELRIKRGAQP